MNCFFARFASLFLAVLFLFSAAGVSFALLFRGVPVHAEEPSSSDTSTELEPPPENDAAPIDDVGKAHPVIVSVKVDGDDIARVALEDGLIPVMVIEVHDTVLTEATYRDFIKDATFSFYNYTNFTFQDGDDPMNSVSFGDPSPLSGGGSGVSYEITLHNVIYTQSGSEVKFKIVTTTYGTFEFSHSVKLPSGSNIYSIRDWAFRNRDENMVSEVKRGTYEYFDITINDSALTAKELEKYKPKGQTEDDDYVLLVNLNSDTFSYKEFFIKDIVDLNDEVSYTLRFKTVYYSGKTNRLKLSVAYGNKDVSKIPTRIFNQTLDELVIYDEDKEHNDDDDDDDDSSSSHPEIAPPTPTLIVSEFSYGNGEVAAASDFNLKIKITNTSKKLPIDNIIVKATVPEAFTMKGSSNTFYIEKMLRGASEEINLSLSVKPGAEPISHPIKLSFTYESVIDEARKQLTSEEEISIPVSQLNRFSMNPIEMPAELYVGESSSIEAIFVNKGKTTIYNVTAEITGNIKQPGQRQFIGNIEGGKEDSADFLIEVEEAGDVKGEVIITYEDANMHVMELREPFSAAAVAYDMPPGDMGAMTPMEPQEAEPGWYRKIPVWGWMTSGVILLIFFCFTVKVLRARRDRQLLEESDEDF